MNDSFFRQVESRLFAAHEGTPDLETIDRLYADDFLSTNADGRVVDKAGWLAILKAGQFPVDRITTDDFRVRTYPGVAIITGQSTYHVGATHIGVRHTQIWANLNDTWRLVSWQGTPLPRIDAGIAPSR